MAVEVREQLPESIQANHQTMRVGHVASDAQHRVPLVRELDSLVEHQRAGDLGVRDEEELLVRVRGQSIEALLQEQRADYVAALSVFDAVMRLDAVQGVDDAANGDYTTAGTG
jgi:hypothetical protein